MGEGRVAESVHGGAVEDLASPGSGIALLVEEQAPVLLSREKSRDDGVDPDPCLAPLARQETGQVQHT